MTGQAGSTKPTHNLPARGYDSASRARRDASPPAAETNLGQLRTSLDYRPFVRREYYADLIVALMAQVLGEANRGLAQAEHARSAPPSEAKAAASQSAVAVSAGSASHPEREATPLLAVSVTPSGR